MRELESDLIRVQDECDKKDKAIIELAQVLDLQMGGTLAHALD